MRLAFVALTLSGILACGSGSSNQQRGPQTGQSTAPLPDDPNAPLAKDGTGPKGVAVPITTPPSSGDVGSPNSPGPTSPATGDMPTPGGTPGTPQPGAPTDAGVWSPPPDAP